MKSAKCKVCKTKFDTKTEGLNLDPFGWKSRWICYRCDERQRKAYLAKMEEGAE